MSEDEKELMKCTKKELIEYILDLEYENHKIDKKFNITLITIRCKRIIKLNINGITRKN